MEWLLFCQIEIILLTVGLVVTFVVKSYQNAKDISFYQRVKALGDALGTTAASAAKEFADKLSQKKEEKE